MPQAVSPWVLTEQDPARARPQRISRLPPTNASPSRPRLGPCIVRRTGGTGGLHEVILSSSGCRAVALPPLNSNQDAGAWCVGPSLLCNSGLPLATRRPKDPLQRNHGGNSSVTSSDSRGEGRGGLVGAATPGTALSGATPVRFALGLAAPFGVLGGGRGATRVGVGVSHSKGNAGTRITLVGVGGTPCQRGPLGIFLGTGF
jgi:hypothetical protein